MARSSTQETKGLWLMVSSPTEWPSVATSFWETMRLFMPIG